MHLCIPLLSILLSKETWLKPPQNTFTLSCHPMFCSRYGFHMDRLTDNLCSGEFGNIPSLFLLMYSQVILYWTRNPPSLFVKELYLIGVLRTTSVTLFLRRTEKLSVMADPTRIELVSPLWQSGRMTTTLWVQNSKIFFQNFQVYL